MEPLHVTLFHGWSRLTTADHGELLGGPMEGFYVAETQLVSHYQIELNGKPLTHRFSVQTAENHWTTVAVDADTIETGNPMAGSRPQGSLEVRLFRKVESGWTDALQVTNHASRAREVKLRFRFACPIGDLEFAEEMKCDGGHRRKPGVAPKDVTRRRSSPALRFERSFGGRRHVPEAVLDRILGDRAPKEGDPVRRAVTVRAAAARKGPRMRFTVNPGRTTIITASVRLGPRKSADMALHFDADIDGTLYPAPEIDSIVPPPEQPSLERTPRIDSGNSTLNFILAQAQRDIHALRLPPYTPRPHGDNDGLIAGVPRYVGVFGRDTITAAWQSALIAPSILRPALERIGSLRGIVPDPWREEEPGRLPHEFRTNPDAAVGRTNRDLYYGDVTSTPLWIVGLETAWNWSGDPELLESNREALESCFDWLVRRLAEGGGFVYYDPPCPGVPGSNRNQAWKDSGDAIVDAGGRIRTPPLAVAEVQGFAYQALEISARFFAHLGDAGRAAKARGLAPRLRADFNLRFWMPRERFIALALDGRGRRIDSVASNAGQCLLTGILDGDQARAVCDRLMSDDMFSGWGVRTLSRGNPSFDPFSYHRGSVWPFENAMIAAGLRAHGRRDDALRVISAQLALATLFQHMRLPELVSGHTREPSCPIPGLYPFCNSLQAWSVSGISQMLETLLGLAPRAPERVLEVDPALPEWLPWIELRGLRVGTANVDLRFERDERGGSHFRVLRSEGMISVRRRARPGAAALKEAA